VPGPVPPPRDSVNAGVAPSWPDRWRRPNGQSTPLTLALKESTAAPTLPFQGSKPAWMLVRYQELFTDGSQVSVLSMKPSTFMLFQELIGVSAT